MGAMTIGLALVPLAWLTTVASSAPAAAPGKVPPAIAREMADAVIAVNKALGLESWPAQGIQPCVDRGGEGTTAKDVSAADTRRCAEQATANGFPELGKGYALAITMSSIGPITVVALGMDQASGFAAYSCDPGRKCPPTKIQPSTKWGKRMVERQQQACRAAETVWLPASARVCPDASPAAAVAPTPAPAPGPGPGPPAPGAPNKP